MLIEAAVALPARGHRVVRCRKPGNCITQVAVTRLITAYNWSVVFHMFYFPLSLEWLVQDESVLVMGGVRRVWNDERTFLRVETTNQL